MTELTPELSIGLDEQDNNWAYGLSVVKLFGGLVLYPHQVDEDPTLLVGLLDVETVVLEDRRCPKMPEYHVYQSLRDGRLMALCDEE